MKKAAHVEDVESDYEISSEDEAKLKLLEDAVPEDKEEILNENKTKNVNKKDIEKNNTKNPKEQQKDKQPETVDLDVEDEVDMEIHIDSQPLTPTQELTEEEKKIRDAEFGKRFSFLKYF